MIKRSLPWRTILPAAIALGAACQSVDPNAVGDTAPAPTSTPDGGAPSSGPGDEVDGGTGDASTADGGDGNGDGGPSDGGDAEAGPPPIVPVVGDAFVSPSGTDGTNDCLAEVTPCKTIAYAVMKVQAGHAVWLADGDYAAGATVPAGVAVRGRNQAAVVKGTLILNGSVVAGIVFDAQNGFGAGVRATGGANALSALRCKGNFANGACFQAAGAASVTLEPGGVTNYVAETIAGVNTGNSSNPLLEIVDAASFTVLGGTFDGPGMGHGADSSKDGGAFLITDTAKLKLVGVQMKVHSRGIVVRDEAELTLERSVITAVDMTSMGFAIGIANDNVEAKVSLTKSTLSGFNTDIRGYGFAVLGVTTHPRVALTVDQSVAQSNTFGVFVAYTGSMSLTGTSFGILANERGGLKCDGACDVDLSDSTFSGNAKSNDPNASFFGALWMGATNVPYHLRLRRTSIGLTQNLAGVTNANVENNSGLVLAGDATSTFDLGTAASPGQNVVQANSSGNLSANLTVKVDAAVVVSAVGNQFDANVQGANATGRFVLGAAPCDPTTCDLTSGAGTNYRVTSGILRLAE